MSEEIIQIVEEEQPVEREPYVKPKRVCSQAQLDNLARGRATAKARREGVASIEAQPPKKSHKKKVVPPLPPPPPTPPTSDEEEEVRYVKVKPKPKKKKVVYYESSDESRSPSPQPQSRPQPQPPQTFRLKRV
jgi:hypothetical protein